MVRSQMQKIDRLRALKEALLRRLLSSHRNAHESKFLTVGLLGDHIADDVRVSGRYEDAFLSFVEDRVLRGLDLALGCCLDVGANIGNHTMAFSRAFARVIAVEPNPMALSILRANLEINRIENVEVIPVGLSDTAGWADFELRIQNLGASRLAPRMDGKLGANRVEIRVGDEVLGGRSVSFIKIDIEGHEARALRGLSQTIRRDLPVIMAEELAAGIAPETGQTEVSTFLRGFGYIPYVLQFARATWPRMIQNALVFAVGSREVVAVRVERFQNINHPVVLYLPPAFASSFDAMESLA